MLAICPGLTARELGVEHLGVVERQAPIGSHAVSPATERYSFRLLIGFKGGDGTWIVNLQNGTSRRAESKGFENDYLGWPSFIGADGKVFSSCAKGSPLRGSALCATNSGALRHPAKAMLALRAFGQQTEHIQP